MNQVFYWNDVFNSSEKFLPYQEELNALLTGDYKSLHLKKLKGNHHPPIYAIRLNIKHRLLFTTYQNKLCLLDVVLEHDYHKSRFLKHPQILKTFMLRLPEEVIENETIVFDDVEILPDLSVQPEQSLLELKPLEPHQRKLVEFSPIQNLALKLEFPAFINGSPGAGKTLVAKAMIIAFLKSYPEQKVLYLTKSTKLVEKVALEFKEELIGCEAFLENIKVSTYDALVFPETSVIDEYDCFCQWVKPQLKHKQEIGLNKEKLFWEIRQLSGLSLEAYQNLGCKQSLVEKDNVKRQQIYELYLAFLSFLKASNLSASSFVECKKQLNFDLIVADEAQDFSTLQLINISHFARFNQICYFLGDHQVLYDGLSKHSIIKDIIYKGQITGFSMPQSFRLPRIITQFTNEIIRLKRMLVGGKADKVESDCIEIADSNDEQGNIVWLDSSNQQDMQLLKTYGNSPTTSVLCFSQHARFFEEQFETPKVFSTQEYKGLEDETIILAGLMDCEQVTEISKLYRNLSEDEQKRGSFFHRPAAKHFNEGLQLVFNFLITAMTRSRKNLFIVEDMSSASVRHRVESIFNVYQAVVALVPQQIRENINQAQAQDWLAEAKRLQENGHQEIAQKVLEKKVKPVEKKDEQTLKIENELDKLVKNFSLARLKVLMNLYHSVDFYCNTHICLDIDSPRVCLLDFLIQDPIKEKIFFKILLNDTQLLLNFPLKEIAKNEGHHYLPSKIKLLEKAHSILFKLYKNSPHTLLKTDQKKFHTPAFILLLQSFISLVDDLIPLGLDINQEEMLEYCFIETVVMQGNLSLLEKAVKDYRIPILDPRNHPARLIHRAVMMNRPHVIDFLHKTGLDINTPYTEINSKQLIIGIAFHETPIFMAIKHQRFECFKILLELGANLNILDAEKNNVLHAVIKYCHTPEKYTALILSKEVNINQMNHLMRTPLFLAAQKDYLQIFNELLEHGADPSINSLYNYSLYHIVAYEGSRRVLSRMLELNLSLRIISDKSETPAHIAVCNGKLSILKDLLKWQPNFFEMQDENGDFLIHRAAQFGFKEIFRFLISKGMSIETLNDSLESPLFYAARYGHLELIEYAILKGINLHAKNFNDDTIAHAALIGKQTIVCVFLAKKAPALFSALNKDGKAFVHLAVEYLNYPMLQLPGLDLNLPDSKGRTIAHYIAINGTVELLSNPRINWRATDAQGNNVLFYAIVHQHQNFIEELLKNIPALVSVINKDGDNLVHIAARYNNNSVLTLLFTQGLEFNLINHAGHRPSMIAIQAGYDKLAERIDELTLYEKNEKIKFFKMMPFLAAEGKTLEIDLKL